MEIALAFRDTTGDYIPHVGAMLASLLACTSRSLRVHVLHDETLTDHGREKLLSLAHPGQEVLFHCIDPRCCLPGMDETSTILRPLTFATLYRLFLPQLPELAHCPRLVYLDTDLIVDTDLGELWESDLGPALLGAVPDPCLRGALTRKGEDHKSRWARRAARHSLALGIPMGRYFNAGVLLLDMDAIRREGLFAAALALVLKEPQLLHPDQDALNKIFYGRSRDLPSTFNHLLHSDPVEGLTEGVWHFSGPRKPWLEDMPKADRYWHYRNQTPWALQK